MTHPYKDILIAIANGEQIQARNTAGEWLDQEPRFTLGEIYNQRFTPECFRVRPKTININGYEVPEPVREPLNIDETYWVAVIGVHSRCSYPWANDEVDRRWLELGIVHMTEEAASIHRKAMLSFTRAK